MRSISVIIATRDRQSLLAETLAALRAQRLPAATVEIVVADNASTDDTRAVVQAAAAMGGMPIHYLYVAQPGKSAAVNAALHQANGDIIAFTDDDVRPEPQWLEAIAAAFRDPEVDFVAGRTFPRWEAPPPVWMSPALYGVLAVADSGAAPLRIGPGQEHPMPIGANMAVRASVVRRIGGLRADLGKLGGTLRTGEDHEFFLRMMQAGCRGAYVPSAVVHHLVPRARLNRSYFRAWLYQNGQDVSRLEVSYPRGRTLLGVPRYLWREAAMALWAFVWGGITFDRARRFAGAVRLMWLAGYVRESWFGPMRVRKGSPLAQPVREG